MASFGTSQRDVCDLGRVGCLFVSSSVFIGSADFGLSHCLGGNNDGGQAVTASVRTGRRTDNQGLLYMHRSVYSFLRDMDDQPTSCGMQCMTAA